VDHGGGPADKIKLNLALSRARKLSSSRTPLVRRHHGVGAVGYAVVLPDRRVPANDFFTHQRTFRVRFRFA